MKKSFALLALTALVLTACTSQQAYNSGQSWQRQECGKNVDKSAYDQCMSRTNVDYDTYKKESTQK